jgi:hypothetical protein
MVHSYFALLAIDYISTSPYGEALGLAPRNLLETYDIPLFTVQLSSAYDAISSSRLFMTCSNTDALFPSSYVHPFLSLKILLGPHPATVLNSMALAAIVIFNFFKVQGSVLFIGFIVWMLCYGRASAVDRTFQVLYDAIAPAASKVREPLFGFAARVVFRLAYFYPQRTDSGKHRQCVQSAMASSALQIPLVLITSTYFSAFPIPLHDCRFM